MNNYKNERRFNKMRSLLINKDKRGKMNSLVTVVLCLSAVVLVIVGASQLGLLNKSQTQLGAGTGGGSAGNVVSLNTQNPSIAFSVVNAQTKQPITANATYWKTVDGSLLLPTASFSAGEVITPLLAATGYISEVGKAWTVVAGSQAYVGSMNQFANETIQIYSNAGTSLLSGTLADPGVVNDTQFASQSNNKIILTGNTYKSSGRMFVVAEFSNTQNVSSMTLSNNGAVVGSASIPNCYTNTLTGTPFRAAWEVPAVVGSAQSTLNLQTSAASGNVAQGKMILSIYNEQDVVDSLNGNFLTSGICDSNNAKTYRDSQYTAFFFI